MGDSAVPASKPGETFLVNLDSSDGGGTHWGFLRHSLQKPDTMLWYDSLGLYPPKPITRSVRARGMKILANDSWTQDINAANDALCGPRAALLACRLHDARHRDLAAFTAL